MFPEIEDLILWSNVFLLFFSPGRSAALSKTDLIVSCWILLLERAPHGLAKQLHVQQSQHGKYDVTRYTKMQS